MAYVYRAKYNKNGEQWRARMWAQGLCGNCGKRPLAISPITGQEMLRCRECQDRTDPSSHPPDNSGWEEIMQ